MLQPCFKWADRGDPRRLPFRSEGSRSGLLSFKDYDGNLGLHRDNERTMWCFEKMLEKEDGD